jgi:urease accessory protein
MKSITQPNLAGLAEKKPVVSLTQSRHACARLIFSTDAYAKTFLAGQRTEHPFHLTRPFQIENDPEGLITLYLQSSSGGLYRGDHLKLDATLEENTQLHLTTQAGTIVHHTRGQEAKQSINLRLEKNSYCEYLPDPTVLFSGAAFCSDIHVEMAENSRLMLSDSFSWHDPRYKKRPADSLADQAFEQYHSNIEIYNERGQVMVLDRFRLKGDVALSNNCGIHGPYQSQGSILLIQEESTEKFLEPLRRMFGGFSKSYAGASLLPNKSGLIIRFLAEDGIELQRILEHSWIVLREQMFGCTPMRRRK